MRSKTKYIPSVYVEVGIPGIARYRHLIKKKKKIECSHVGSCGCRIRQKKNGCSHVGRSCKCRKRIKK